MRGIQQALGLLAQYREAEVGSLGLCKAGYPPANFVLKTCQATVREAQVAGG